jgi:two-component system, OmpR family, response regulator
MAGEGAPAVGEGNSDTDELSDRDLRDPYSSETTMRILVVEDDPVLRDGLSRSLRNAGYVVDVADDGKLADQLLSVHAFDLVVLDLGLPGLDGVEVLRRLRRRGSTIPVLILTARDAVEDRVAGLDCGADDYLVKPFNLAELEARTRALMRRAQSAATSRISHGALTLDVAARRAFVGDDALDLSAREVALLEALLLSAGRVVSKDQLADRLYGVSDEVGPNAIEVFVHRLRRKIEHAGVAIRTIRGLGYLVEKPGHV